MDQVPFFIMLVKDIIRPAIDLAIKEKIGFKKIHPMIVRSQSCRLVDHGSESMLHKDFHSIAELEYMGTEEKIKKEIIAPVDEAREITEEELSKIEKKLEVIERETERILLEGRILSLSLEALKNKSCD